MRLLLAILAATATTTLGTSMLRNMGANSYTPPGPGQPFIGCVQRVGDHSLRLIEPNESCRNNEIRIQLGAVTGPAGT